MENAEDENKKRRASDQAIRSSIDAKRVKMSDEEASSDNDVVLPTKERWQGECIHSIAYTCNAMTTG